MDSENQRRQENNENQYNVTARCTVLKDYELMHPFDATAAPS